MTKIDVTLSSEYGIMFLYDARAAPSIPSEAGRDPVMSTNNCISFSVLSYVDGDAKIILTDQSSGQEYEEYFSGQIECPSRAVSLFDHNGFAFASVPLTDNFASISLLMSEETNPDIVECVIKNMQTY